MKSSMSFSLNHLLITVTFSTKVAAAPLRYKIEWVLRLWILWIVKQLILIKCYSILPINLKRSDKYVALSKLSIYYTWKNIKTSNNINKFKTSPSITNEHILYQMLKTILSISSNTWDRCWQSINQKCVKHRQ